MSAGNAPGARVSPQKDGRMPAAGCVPRQDHRRPPDAASRRATHGAVHGGINGANDALALRVITACKSPFGRDQSVIEARPGLILTTGPVQEVRHPWWDPVRAPIAPMKSFHR